MDKFKNVPVPKSLTREQVRLAQLFVKERHESRITVGEFCTKHGISTATWSSVWKKQPDFEGYLVSLGSALISEDSWKTYEIVKKKIEAMATAEKAGVKEIQLYLQTFDFMREADIQRQKESMGLTRNGIPTSEDARTIEEKKASLLSRLKGNGESK